MNSSKQRKLWEAENGALGRKKEGRRQDMLVAVALSETPVTLYLCLLFAETKGHVIAGM